MHGIVFYIALIFLFNCSTHLSNTTQKQGVSQVENGILPGADRLSSYYPLIKGKKVGLVVNQTSRISDKHIVDSLFRLGIDIKIVFAPEHGFRGEADAGEAIRDENDPVTGIPLLSLYGSKKKPGQQDLIGIDIMIFDIQDVGVRFYTYISTLHYIMEACAENNLPLIVLDRPNPNGHYVDGPVLQKGFESFIGMHPVPVVYGMTIGEYARMINGESWLKGGIQCNLTVIECKNYSHDTFYELPIRPSPNLPNARSILLYPSLCFFEGTHLSIGRGTEKQFQIIGHPGLQKQYGFSFTPKPNPGAKTPFLEGITCYGEDLTYLTIQELRDQKRLDLSYLLKFYKECNLAGETFFLKNLFFDKLAGTDSLRNMLLKNYEEDEIRASWAPDIEFFKKTRKKYLLYD